jgi:uncharacterized protein YigE (DUF2233 family)
MLRRGDHRRMPLSCSLLPAAPSSPALSRCLATALLLMAAVGCSRPADAVDTRAVIFDSQSYRVVTIDLRREQIELRWRNPADGQPFGSIEALRDWSGSRGRTVLFATNAGIYDRQFAPLGLYVEDGKTVVPLNLAHGDPRSGNFSLLPNGVFAIYDDGHAEVRSSQAYRLAGNKPRWATQSGPMLVVDGQLNPQFVDDSESMKWRSGVCARTPNEVVFAVSEAPVNFHGFARLFRDELGCRDALFLDGTISQFYIDQGGSGTYTGAPAFMTKPYAGMIAVFAKDP